MYRIGDLAVYGIHGVCRIVGTEQKVVDRKEVTYLALEPVTKADSRFLVPTHNAVAMAKLRPLHSAGEWKTFWQSEDMMAGEWILDDNRRKQAYRDLMAAGDTMAMAKMVYQVQQHKERVFAAGKKFHQCDDTFLRDAQRLIAGEMSVAMEMEFSDALQYLREKIKKDA